jgi:hypothetical protein
VADDAQEPVDDRDGALRRSIARTLFADDNPGLDAMSVWGALVGSLNFNAASVVIVSTYLRRADEIIKVYREGERAMLMMLRAGGSA